MKCSPKLGSQITHFSRVHRESDPSNTEKEMYVATLKKKKSPMVSHPCGVSHHRTSRVAHCLAENQHRRQHEQLKPAIHTTAEAYDEKHPFSPKWKCQLFIEIINSRDKIRQVFFSNYYCYLVNTDEGLSMVAHSCISMWEAWRMKNHKH